GRPRPLHREHPGDGPDRRLPGRPALRARCPPCLHRPGRAANPRGRHGRRRDRRRPDGGRRRGRRRRRRLRPHARHRRGHRRLRRQ
ncbi:MAG: hypothetical protein AVDCRST_MAG33-550, partial [uncultured Thermomicrobiales bacterium]